VKLEPMIKMEAEKEPTLGSVEKEKRISFQNRLKTKNCTWRITRKIRKEIIWNSSRKSMIKKHLEGPTGDGKRNQHKDPHVDDTVELLGM